MPHRLKDNSKFRLFFAVFFVLTSLELCAQIHGKTRSREHSFPSLPSAPPTSYRTAEQPYNPGFQIPSTNALDAPAKVVSSFPSNVGTFSLDINKAVIINPPEHEPKGDTISINFEGVEVMNLLRYLSQETGKGFIIDSPVQGNVTIISPITLTKDEALTMLESILQVKGYSAIPSGRMYKIVPLGQAKVAGTETRFPEEISRLGVDDKLITQILPLEKISVNEAQGVLSALLPPDSSIMVYTQSNTLVLTGRSVNIKRALEVLSELEKGQPYSRLEIIPLQNSNAQYLKTQLDQIILSNAFERKSMKGGITILPDPRMNSLLVLSAPENFEGIRLLVKRLDAATIDTRKEITRFFSLKFADETETAKQLLEMLGIGRRHVDGTASESQAVESTRIIPVKRTRSIMVSTRSEEVIKRIEALLEHLDKRTPVETSNVQFVRVVNAESKTLAETLTRLVQDKGKGKGGPLGDNISFVADTHTNSLIVIAPPQVFAQYESIIKSLDIMRPQILVETLIAEISANRAKNLGIEWGVIDQNKESYRAFGGTNFGLRSQTVSAQGLTLGVLKGTLDIQKVRDGDISELSKIKALLHLYQNNSDFNILSAPQVLTTDNEEAKIIVGEVVPLPQGFTKDRDSGRFDLTNFKYEDVGINITLTPRVNSEKMVTLKIDQEVKKRQEENLYQFNVPVITKRQVTTTVTIPNHETIVIGGLMREDKTVVEDRVPVFSNIPLIGKAFRNKRKSLQKTNLLVFLTPHILSTPAQVAGFDSTEFKKGEHSPESNKRLEPQAVEDRLAITRKKALEAFEKLRRNRAKGNMERDEKPR